MTQQSLFDGSVQTLNLADATIDYVPHFIQGAENCYDELVSTTAWQQDTIKVYGREILIPRMNAWYGDEAAHYHYSGLKLEPIAWTPALFAIKNCLEEFTSLNFNSVLANWYRDGADSVSWHSDDEADLGPQPVIASLSFGATRRFSLRRRDGSGGIQHIDLENGSLLLMSGDTQRYWHHQLAKTQKAVAGRVNLTFRQVII